MIKKLNPQIKYYKHSVISLCDFTGNMVRPWAEEGYECYCIDTKHSICDRKVMNVGKGRIWFIWGDIRTWSPELEIISRLKILFAFPPCTHMTVSGSQHFRNKGTALLRDSLEMFSACEHAGRWSGVPYMIENPVGKFSDHMGKPDYIFDPYNYGDNYTKKTCLWTGNNFIMPEFTIKTKPIDVDTKKIHYMGGYERGREGTSTPEGFSKKVFEVNHALFKSQSCS